MTPNQINSVIAEIEKLWKSRTPATCVNDAIPEERVNRYEVMHILKPMGLQFPIRNDEFDTAIFNLFDRLRKEYPNEKWQPRKNWTSATKQRRKELGIK